MKRVLIGIFLFLFGAAAFLPLIQQIFQPAKLAGLQGAFDAGSMPVFNFEGYAAGTFQTQTDHYLKYNTAFNGELVRLRNQIDYSLFGNINTILTLGKENYIFDPAYIRAREGKDLKPASYVDSLRNNLSILNSFLKKDNIPLLVVFPPNKANFYSEFLPGNTYRSAETNKSHLISILNSLNIRFIDFDKWFISLRDKSGYPLMPKYGAHWTTYGASVAADSILSVIGFMTGKTVAGFNVTGFDLKDEPMFTDDDYLPSLNLMNKWVSPAYAYPKLEFTEGVKPRLFIVSDSYIWSFYDLEITQNCFNDNTILNYYNKSLYDSQRNYLGPLPSVSPEQLRSFDLVILINSEAGMNHFGFGFLEKMSDKISGIERQNQKGTF